MSPQQVPWPGLPPEAPPTFHETAERLTAEMLQCSMKTLCIADHRFPSQRQDALGSIHKTLHEVVNGHPFPMKNDATSWILP